MDTESLVREFRRNPGAENENLEFKSKGILGDTEGKKKLVRICSAMANGAGGVIIVGVRNEEDGLNFQSFQSTEEARQELTHIAQEYTRPRIFDWWEISFDSCFGHQLMRIDIEDAESELIRFNYGGDFEAFIREEDCMREMTAEEVLEFSQEAENDRSRLDDEIQQTESPTFTPDPANADIFEDPHNRVVTKYDGSYTFIFGSGLLADRFGKSHSYSLNAGSSVIDDYSSILDVVKSAEEHLGARTNWDFGYTIRNSNVQWMGCSLESLKNDLSVLNEVAPFLAEISNSDWGYGPLVSGYMETSYGVLWYEIQKESNTFYRSNVEIVLPDIPFNDSPIADFFDDLGSTPHFYDHTSGRQYFRFEGPNCRPLRNPTPIDLHDDDEYGTIHIEADNPFYGWPDSLEEEIEEPLPDWIPQELGSIERIPLQVAGGYLDDEPDRFWLDYLEFRYIRGTHPTVLADCLCRQVDS